ncbi:ParA family protein [Lachnotalea glycerini]|uniref:ParA family protein n=1 Tax=Lachnotalea glycerini TaxID=1763509 RepID=A0A371JBN6_9FIRM|nr:ParA family protein [Lachnotalea glycerini]RDY30169.1 ParA family protein [Lachnotalea glycerini]
MKTTSLLNLKGGIGKSQTAINTSYNLTTLHNKKVLLIDNDIQGNTSKFFKRYNPIDTKGTAELLRNKAVYVKDLIKHTEYENLDIITANMHLESAMMEVTFDKESSQHDRFREKLEQVSDLYDYCFIDNAPSIGMQVINALCASDEVIIPIQLDNWSLDGLEILTKTVEQIKILNNDIKIAGCLITAYQKNEMTEAAEEWLRTQCNQYIFNQRIRFSKKVSTSTYYNQPLDLFSKRCAAAVDYRRFVKEYLERGEV